MLLLNSKVSAQSLGDPIVNITFGSGTAQYPGPLSVDSGSTTYTYINGTPNDGQYTIANSTAGMFSAWYYTTDHTGNPGGYMMVVNGSYAPGTFYTRTVTGLCENTQYQFAAWLKNIFNTLGGIRPNVTFSIETTGGAVLASFNTGAILEGNTWKQSAFTFTTPVNVNTVVIRMQNNAPGGNGNDIVIDDITFRAYGATSTAAFDDLLTTRTSCIGNKQVIQSTSTLAAGNLQKLQELVSGVWVDQSAAGTATSFTVTSPTTAGTYYYRIVSGASANINSPSCIVASNTVALTLVPPPVAAFSVADNSCLGTNVNFIDQSTSTGSAITGWLWDFGDGSTSVLQSPFHFYTKAGSYKVTLSVTNSTGCTSVSTLPKTIQIIAPVASFTYDSSDATSKSITFTDQSTTNSGVLTSWFWDFGDGTTDIRTNNKPFQHTYTAVGTYTVKLTVTSSIGCADSYAAPVIVLNPFVVNNTFTPNGDGINDTWEIKYLDSYTGCTVNIFNRYGVKLFSSVGYPIPWNGQYNNRDVPSGVYYYVIDPKHGQKTVAGWVTIIR